MKKTTLTILTAICGLSFLIFACRKELNNIVQPNQSNVSTNLLESAKIFNAKVLAANATINAKIPGYFTLKPLWDDAFTIDISNNSKLIAVPTIENYVSNKEVSIRRLFIFKAHGDQVSDGKIVEFIGTNYDVSSKLNMLVSNFQNNSISGYNGAVIQYDLNYRWMHGVLYNNGAIVHNNVTITKSTSSNDFNLNLLSDTGVGKQTFLFKQDRNIKIMSDGDGTGNLGGSQSLSAVVIYGGGSYGGGGGLWFPDPLPIAQGGTSTWVSPELTSDQVLNPCIKSMLNEIVYSSAIRGRVSMLIRNAFFGTDQPDISFSDPATISSGADADAIPTVDYSVSPPKLLKVKIRFKASVYAATTKEYIAVTIMHEALHAYLDSRGITLSDPSHITMATDYINMMADDLKDMFPTMSNDSAYALAWSGLEGYKSTIYGTLIYLGGSPPYFPPNQGFLRNAYADGLLGTKCSN
jgi:uncharacterized membrane protein YgcG